MLMYKLIFLFCLLTNGRSLYTFLRQHSLLEMRENAVWFVNVHYVYPLMLLLMFYIKSSVIPVNDRPFNHYFAEINDNSMTFDCSLKFIVISQYTRVPYYLYIFQTGEPRIMPSNDIPKVSLYFMLIIEKLLVINQKNGEYNVNISTS